MTMENMADTKQPAIPPLPAPPGSADRFKLERLEELLAAIETKRREVRGQITMLKNRIAKEEREARWIEVLILRDQGLSWKKIGQRVGRTAETAAQRHTKAVKWALRHRRKLLPNADLSNSRDQKQ
jgi:hypothetical protein